MSNAKKKTKSKYAKPELKRIGSLKELSQTSSTGSKTDGGAFPANKHMCLTPPSALEEHRILLQDSNCQNSYRREIFKVVKEGDVVLDLGTGSGIHTIFALLAGAKKVYAIDLHPLIETAKEVIADNGFSDRVEFIRGNSREINLPEKVDVIISNIGFLHTLNDLPLAVKKFLKPKGRVLPESAALSIVPVQASDLYQSNIENWSANPFGINFKAFRKLAVNHPIYWELATSHMISRAQTMNPISFQGTIEKVLSWKAHFTIEKKSVLHGIGGWYAFFSNGEEFLSTQPPMNLQKELWQNFVFPLEAPLAVQKGDRLDVHIEMHREMIQEAPIWQWQTILNGQGVYNQSSFAGVPI